MATHPANLLLRFLLELVALLGVGRWAYLSCPTGTSTGMRWFAGLLAPIVMAAMWGTFAVPDDPSRSGRAPVPTPGALRLLLELAFFGVAAYGIHAAGHRIASYAFATLVVLHYASSVDRIRWLLGY